MGAIKSRFQAPWGKPLRNPLLYGTGNLGVEDDEAESRRMLNLWLDLGGEMIDTARVYSDWVPGETGRSERIIGDWLRGGGARERVSISTKGGHPPLDGMKERLTGPEQIRADLEASLRALGTECVELYWLHMDQPSRPVAPIIDLLESFVAEGKILSYGLSNWSVPRLDEARRYAEGLGRNHFAGSQPCWSLASLNAAPRTQAWYEDMDAACMAWHRKSQLPVFPYTSQASGFFTKLQAALSCGEADERFRGDRYYNPANRALCTAVAEVAAAHGASVNAVALAWLIRQPFPVFPIIGSRTEEQMRDSISATEIRFEAAELEQLSRLAGLKKQN